MKDRPDVQAILESCSIVCAELHNTNPKDECVQHYASHDGSNNGGDFQSHRHDGGCFVQTLRERDSKTVGRGKPENVGTKRSTSEHN
jgi:hypothetical protein